MQGIFFKKIAPSATPTLYRRVAADRLFAVVLFLTSIAVYVPFLPDMPSVKLDPSWMFGMNQAVAQGLAFGKDMVFTFGPYASIYTKIYHPATDQLMMVGALYLGISFFLAAYLNFQNAKWQSQVALMVVLSGLMYSRDSLFFFYPLLVGVQVHRQLAGPETEKAGRLLLVAILWVLFAPFGLLPLIKGSTLVACVAVTVFSVAFLLKNKRPWLGVFVGITPVVSLAVFWVLAGQALGSLPAYFLGLAPIMSGYTDAMAISGNLKELVLYVIAAIVVLRSLFRETNGTLFARSFVVLTFMCILFLTFKAGFVRHDGHTVISGTMILMAAILAGTLMSPRSAVIAFCISFAAWFYMDTNHLKSSTYSIWKGVQSTYADAWAGIKLRASQPEKLLEKFADRVADLKELGDIPKLEGTTDIYSYDQSYLIASGNTWNPRPVLQSYSAYTLSLAEKNKAHLLGQNRPDNIVFKVQSIDGRLPSLDDGASWPVLMANYVPDSIRNDYLFLKHRSPGDEQPFKVVSTSSRVHSFGEMIDLPSSEGVVFVKLNIKKNLLGSFFDALYKTGPLEIKVVMKSGEERIYRMIAGMAEAGFILSPLIEDTHEFGVLYSDPKYLYDKKVKSISIYPKSVAFLWKKGFEMEISLLQRKENPAVIERLGLSLPTASPISKIGNADHCEGSIDYINGASPAPKSVRATALLNVRGWLASAVNQEVRPDQVYLVLSDMRGKRYFIQTQSPKKIMPEAFSDSSQADSLAFTAAANVMGLKGKYLLGLAYSNGGELFVCPEAKIRANIGQE